MVLTQLRIQGFKAWRDTGRIDLAPLTVLFGANSSGKSSINHLLMMLKQTVRSPDRNSVFDFGGGGGAILNLGSLRDVSFQHDLERPLRFEMEWRLPTALTLRDPETRWSATSDRLGFQAEARQSPRSRVVQSEGFGYALGPPNDRSVTVELRRGTQPDRWRLRTPGIKLSRVSRGRAWQLPKPIQFYGFPPEATTYYRNARWLGDLQLELQNQLSELSYLGPIRSHPLPLYSWSGGEPEDVGYFGESTVQAILAASQRRFNWRSGARTEPFEAVIAKWLERMGLVHSFSVEPIARGRDEYEVLLRTSSESEQVRLSDVGFGVSQVLPVIVQAFYCSPHSTVLMEQPEIHLHPSAQSVLADLFIDAVTARADGEPRGVQLVVESHSEHFLRRLQRRVAERAIQPEEVALFFCRPHLDGSIIERLEIDKYGDILNWPPNFFGDELGDVFAQAENCLHGPTRIQGRLTLTSRECLVIDTNVFAVAEGLHRGASAECQAECLRVLKTIEEGLTEVVVDQHDLILTEYLGALSSGGTAGIAVVLARKIWRTRWGSLMSKTVPITPANDGSGSFDEVPSRLRGFDNDDHKFLAVAVAEGSTPPIFAAMDGEWWERRKDLTNEGLSVLFPCSPDLIRNAAGTGAS